MKELVIENAKLRAKVRRQRMELRRLNQVLAPYYKGRFDGFSHGIEISVRRGLTEALDLREASKR